MDKEEIVNGSIIWQDLTVEDAEEVSEFYSKVCEIIEDEKKVSESKSKLCRLNIFSYYTEEGDTKS